MTIYEVFEAPQTPTANGVTKGRTPNREQAERAARGYTQSTGRVHLVKAYDTKTGRVWYLN